MDYAVMQFTSSKNYLVTKSGPAGKFKIFENNPINQNRYYFRFCGIAYASIYDNSPRNYHIWFIAYQNLTIAHA